MKHGTDKLQYFQSPENKRKIDIFKMVEFYNKIWYIKKVNESKEHIREKKIFANILRQNADFTNGSILTFNELITA